MSYDLQIWSVRPAAASDVLPNPTTWIANGQSWMHERRDWQIVIGRSVKVLPEDVPEAVAQALPGIDCESASRFDTDRRRNSLFRWARLHNPWSMFNAGSH